MQWSVLNPHSPDRRTRTDTFLSGRDVLTFFIFRFFFSHSDYLVSHLCIQGGSSFPCCFSVSLWSQCWRLFPFLKRKEEIEYQQLRLWKSLEEELSMEVVSYLYWSKVQTKESERERGRERERERERMNEWMNEWPLFIHGIYISKRKTTALQKSRVKGNTSYSKVKIYYTLIDYIYTELKWQRGYLFVF